jgi:hypothetical protein
MIRSQVVRSMGLRRRALIVAVALMAPLACLGIASPALAKEPTGDFAVFKQCPRFTPEVGLCLYSQTTSGEVTLNKQTVPITNTITLQGGIKRNEVTEVETFVAALNGETLSKSPQKVPGGLAGLVKCNEITNLLLRISCELIFENGLTGVNAVTELAKPASEIGINTNNLVNREGVALSLPIKVRLENPLLGSGCYIGSSTNPIVLNLTTGTTSPPKPNEPISGKVGSIHVKDEGTFVELQNNTLVDNAFAAPVAKGCAGGLLDGIINNKIGLPSAAGKNTAIQNNTVKQASGEAVIASEK